MSTASRFTSGKGVKNTNTQFRILIKNLGEEPLHLVSHPWYILYIQGVPKLFIQINTGGREHENKYISLWQFQTLGTI